MSVCFYNTAGVVAGLDIHKYYVAAPPTPGVPILLPYATTAMLGQTAATDWKRTARVTSQKEHLIQGGHDLYLVPHIPTDLLPPGPAQAIEYTNITLGSSSKAVMKVHKVTGQGKGLATCMMDCAGLNSQCAEPFSTLTGAVVSVNSVMTSPTLGDYAGAFYEYVLGSLVSFGLNKIIGKSFAPLGPVGEMIAKQIVKHLFRRRAEIFDSMTSKKSIVSSVLNAPSKLAEAVQRALDGEPIW